MIEMRPVINQSSQTIDAVISKLKRSFLQFADLLMEQFGTAGTPQSALMPLMTLKGAAVKREPRWYNNAINYLRATREALSAKEEIFELLASSQPWLVKKATTSEGESEPSADSETRTVEVGELPSIKAERTWPGLAHEAHRA